MRHIVQTNRKLLDYALFVDYSGYYFLYRFQTLKTRKKLFSETDDKPFNFEFPLENKVHKEFVSVDYRIVIE